MTDLLTSVADGVAVLTLNRPEKLNAYSREMGRLLSEAYLRYDEDDDVRAIVVTGAGRAFCAGADVSGDPFAARPEDEAFTSSPVTLAFELRTPVIAAVNGHAIGVGLTLALHADIRVVADNAKYGVVQVRRGVVPDCAAHWTLPKLVGMSAALDLLLTGRTFDGAEAVALGVAKCSVTPEAVLGRAMEIARDIADNVVPMSAALTKRLLWDSADRGYTAEEVAWLETQAHHRVMGTPDAKESMAAFKERRTPRWSGSVSADWINLPTPLNRKDHN